MRSLISAVAQGKLIAPGSAEVSLVLSNNADAPGLDFARINGIEARVLDHRQFETRDAFDSALLDILREAADIVLLAGFMRILGEPVVNHFRGSMLNIHPSLLPKYPGQLNNDPETGDHCEYRGRPLTKPLMLEDLQHENPA